MRDTTMKDIAGICNVSVKTISRVINNSPKVKPETRALVEKAMLEHGYRANIMARGLKNKKTNTIIVFIDRHKDIYWGMWHTKMITCLFREAKSHGYKIVLSPSSATDHIDDDTDGFHLLASKMADGAIILDNAEGDTRLEYLKRMKIPYVLMGQADDDQVTWVDIDNESVGRVGCEYLINKGYNKICFFLGQAQFRVSQLRAKGFEEMAKEKGIDYKIYFEMDTMKVVSKKVKELYNEFKFDALYVSGSERAIGAYCALNEMGVSIPESVAVLGIDNLDITENIYPPMSVVDQHCDVYARNVLKILIDLIEGKDKLGAKHLFVQNTIVERRST